MSPLFMTLTLETGMTSKDTVMSIRKVLKRVHAKILFNVFSYFVVHKLYPTHINTHTHTYIYIYIYIYIFIYLCPSSTVVVADRVQFFDAKDSNFFPG